MNFSRHCGIVMIIWMLASAGHSLSASLAEVVRPEFLNELRIGDSNPPAGQSTSMTLFGGNIDPVETAPAGASPGVGPILLVESSFGQALATDIPYPDFTLDAMLSAQKMLYPPAEWNRATVESSNLIFRYKMLLYDKGSGGVALDPGAIKRYFGDAERGKFGEAVKRMRDALKYAPYDRTLRNTLLDAYYDLAVTEALFAKMDRAEIAEYRLGLRPVDSGVFVIDREISLTTAILTRYETALIRYGELLTDRMGVDVSAYDASLDNGMPLGAWVFQQEQPIRSQYAAQFYDDADGVLKTVPYYDPDLGQTTTNGKQRVLFSGYKDYVNLLGMLREYTVNAAELARLYGMRGQPNDIHAAYELIGRVQRETQLQVLLLRGMFPGYEPAPGDASGLSSAINVLGVGLAELDNTRAFLDGESNLLGFDPNFLVLIKEAPDGTDRFDSYDALIHWIGAPRSGSPLATFTPLGAAAKAFDAARASHDTYKGNADQVWTQLNAITGTYSKRYLEITGWEPGDTTTNHILEPKSGYELWQAHRNVELMNTRVEGIRRQANNLAETITQAGELITFAKGKAGELDTAKHNYFNDTASTWDELHTWKARMAGWQATYDMVADASGVDGVATAATYGIPVALITAAGATNIAVQTAGAKRTSRAEQDLAQAAANYEVAVMKLDIPAEIVQAKIEVEDRLREQISLTLEMEDALAMQTQEIGRRQALISELERIRQQAGESDAGLADRYFADPIHFLRAQNDMILADQAFRRAQRWVFFTLRALEFKWNKDFILTSGGKNWELSTLFKLRNYAELEQLVTAMEEFNLFNNLNQSFGHEVTRISLRDDVLAPPAGGFDGLWMDVVSREPVSAIELFRRKLHRCLDKDGNLVILLNTFALKKDTGFFFVGPRYSSDGRVISPGTYLDKIDWIKFNVVGSHTPATRVADLSYGGTCYIRTRMPPCGNLAEPFRLKDEFRAFPFFYFRTLDNGATWQTLPAHGASVKVAFTQTPGEPEPDLIYPNSDLKNNFLKERSVAATQWVLTLFAGSFNIDQLEDIEIHIRHRYALREQPTCP